MLFLSNLPRRHPTLLFGAALVALVVASGIGLDRLAGDPPATVQDVQRRLGAARASWEVRQLVQWVVQNRDNAQAPFLVVDKSQARLYTFDAAGVLQASSHVLLGALRSDEAEAAATPAGRFSARDGGGATARLVWADPHSELALYGMRNHQTPGRAAWRLASDRPDDKRISDGSLHVPPEFFRDHLAALRGRPSTLYVLPETTPRLRVASTTRPPPIRRPS